MKPEDRKLIETIDRKLTHFLDQLEDMKQTFERAVRNAVPARWFVVSVSIDGDVEDATITRGVQALFAREAEVNVFEDLKRQGYHVRHVLSVVDCGYEKPSLVKENL